MRGNVTILTLLLLSVVPLFGSTLTDPDTITRRVVAPDQAAPNNKFITPVNTFKFRARGGMDLVETFSINSPGSFYLVEDIGYEGRNSATSAGGACSIYINSDNVVIDLGNYTLYNNTSTVTGSAQKGIDIASGKRNIVIRNGNINGFQDSGIYARSNCDDVRLQNLTITQCSKQGVYLDGTADTSPTSQNMITNCVIEDSAIGRTTGTSSDPARGLFLNNCFNILVSNCSLNRSDVGSNDQVAYGVLISSSTNVIFNNCEASGNRGSGISYGFHIYNQSQACSFINCTANGNWGTSESGIGFGFSAQYVHGCLWENCTANANEGSTIGYGFSWLGAKYNKITKCSSFYNKGNSKSNSNGGGARSFNSQDGEANIWEYCEAIGSQVSSTSFPIAQCLGFNLVNETNSLIQGCTSRNHNISSNDSWGIGINLQNCTRCTIDNCSITGNKSATTNHGLGLRDTNTGSSTTLITRSFFFNNGDTTSTAQNVHLSYYLGGELNITTTVNQGSMKSLTGINPYENVSMSYV